MKPTPSPGSHPERRTWKRTASQNAAASAVGWTVYDFVCAFVCGSAAALVGEQQRAATQAAVSAQKLFASHPGYHPASVAAFGALFAVCVASLSHWGRSAHFQQTDGVAYEQLQILKTVTLAALAIRGVLMLLKVDLTTRVILESEIFLTFWGMALARVYWRWHRLSWRRRWWGQSSRNFAVAGFSPEGAAIRDYLTLLSYGGYHFKGFILLDESESSKAVDSAPPLIGPVIGPLEGSVARARAMLIDEIFFMKRPRTPALLQTLQEARSAGIDLRLVPEPSETLQQRSDVHFLGDLPTIILHRNSTQDVSRFLKRGLDVYGAAAGLILLLPLLPIVALLIVLDSRGSVFDVSERVGLKGAAFRCYKLRTSVEKSGSKARVTRLGGVLRKYAVDELPQLWNVLRGEMSLVGPRPPLGHAAGQEEIDQFCRLEVLPGITGLRQVESRGNPAIESSIEWDRRYASDWTFWLDLRILLRTAWMALVGNVVPSAAEEQKQIPSG